MSSCCSGRRVGIYLVLSAVLSWKQLLNKVSLLPVLGVLGVRQEKHEKKINVLLTENDMLILANK